MLRGWFPSGIKAEPMRPRSPHPFVSLFACALVCAFVCATSACSGVEISLQLTPGTDSVTRQPTDTSSIRTLHIRVTSVTGRDDEEIPLDAGKQTALSVKQVDNKNPVNIDVRGCEGDTCSNTSDVKFRGCASHIDLSQAAGTTKPVDIFIFRADDVDCGPLD